MFKKSANLFVKRKNRVRFALKKRNISDRLRLAVFRSNKHLYVQLVDDIKSVTITSASTLEKSSSIHHKRNNIEAAAMIGKLIAERAKKLNISKVVFDRSGYLYHGRVKALAEAAREGGLLF